MFADELLIIITPANRPFEFSIRVFFVKKYCAKGMRFFAFGGTAVYFNIYSVFVMGEQENED